MDPVATIVALLEGGLSRTERAELLGALQGWYAAGGFRPPMMEVDYLFYRRNPNRRWTKALATRARKYGARN